MQRNGKTQDNYLGGNAVLLTGRRCSFVPGVHSLPRAPRRPLTHRRPPAAPRPPPAAARSSPAVHHLSLRNTSRFSPTRRPCRVCSRNVCGVETLPRPREGSGEWEPGTGCVEGRKKDRGVKVSGKPCIWERGTSLGGGKEEGGRMRVERTCAWKREGGRRVGGFLLKKKRKEDEGRI